VPGHQAACLLTQQLLLELVLPVAPFCWHLYRCCLLYCYWLMLMMADPWQHLLCLLMRQWLPRQDQQVRVLVLCLVVCLWSLQ
jgi:hypothetical protein